MHKIRFLTAIVLLIAVLGLYGCETAKGFGKDVHNTWENISRTDKWFQKNAW